jgi:hypothetical protein
MVWAECRRFLALWSRRGRPLRSCATGRGDLLGGAFDVEADRVDQLAPLVAGHRREPEAALRDGRIGWPEGIRQDVVRAFG